MARLKIAVLVLAIAVVGALAAAYAYLRSIDFDRYRDEIAADLGRAVGVVTHLKTETRSTSSVMFNAASRASAEVRNAPIALSASTCVSATLIRAQAR